MSYIKFEYTDAFGGKITWEQDFSGGDLGMSSPEYLAEALKFYEMMGYKNDVEITVGNEIFGDSDIWYSPECGVNSVIQEFDEQKLKDYFDNKKSDCCLCDCQ